MQRPTDGASSVNRHHLHAESTPFHFISAHLNWFRHLHIYLESGQSVSTIVHLFDVIQVIDSGYLISTMLKTLPKSNVLCRLYWIIWPKSNCCAFCHKSVHLFMMAAPIQNQRVGDEINCDMPIFDERVPLKKSRSQVLTFPSYSSSVCRHLQSLSLGTWCILSLDPPTTFVKPTTQGSAGPLPAQHTRQAVLWIPQVGDKCQSSGASCDFVVTWLSHMHSKQLHMYTPAQTSNKSRRANQDLPPCSWKHFPDPLSPISRWLEEKKTQKQQ